MIVPIIINVAIREFKQKMAAMSENWDTESLTAPLAQQVTAALKDALTSAGAAALQAFVQSYNPTDLVLEVNDQRLRFKMISPKEFLTCFGPMTLERSLYQADAGGRGYVPLDEFWDMAGEFATAEVREAVLFSVAHVTPQETEQLLHKCAWFHPSATAIKNIVIPMGDFIKERGEDLDSILRAEALTLKEQFEMELAAVEDRLKGNVVKILLLDGHRGLWHYVEATERFDDYEKPIDYYHTTESTFFRRNQPRMPYASFRRRGLPMGSGPVEAACKTIVKTRLCRSGMRWSRTGGQRILSLRTYVKSQRWDRFWHHYLRLRQSA